MNPSSKISPAHLERAALVYIRQSSMRQVEENLESQDLQYQLAQRARALGWAEARIQIIDTTLGYARLYDGTLAADYYRAMNEVERQLELVERPPREVPSPGELIALLNSLRSGVLNESQVNIVQAIRDGILALARREREELAIKDVKELDLAV